MSSAGELSHSQKPVLRVQINHIDHTLIQPGPLDNSSLPRVPIIRVFGASSLGKNTCLHVHQVYPYFFVEYKGKLNANHGQSYPSFELLCTSNILSSEPLRHKTDAFVGPCYCFVFQTQPSFTQCPLYSRCHSRERCSFLWLPFVLFSILEGSSCQSCMDQSRSCDSTIWSRDEHTVSCF